ncbi:thioredoxin family protein [Salinibacter ruber]|uniref:thioredoxin family protein n=1 Tax=Salinibacter ruber TaxID=146919 RepID=UPI002166CF80|nr:thioredoxin fold domain-containing protein [Salinibacter ruber]
MTVSAGTASPARFARIQADRATCSVPERWSSASGRITKTSTSSVCRTWCPYCQRMQENVYADAEVRSYLDRRFTYARLNRDTTGGAHRFNGRTLSSKELGMALGARGVPTTVFMKPDGTPIAKQPGYIKRPVFLQMLRYFGSGAYEEQSFEAFRAQASE